MSRSLIALLFVAFGLAGCSGMRLVDSDVRSFATPPYIPVGASYRFERLPSQQTDPAAQNQLEAMAQQALGKVGLQRNDATARYSVQVSYVRQVAPYAPWEPVPYGWWPGWSVGFGVQSGHVLLGGHRMMPGFGPPERPYYLRQVSLIMRHLGTAKVVYETYAEHDGPWADNEAVLPAMLDAALKDFPNPPPGVRRINLEIPR